MRWNNGDVFPFLRQAFRLVFERFRERVAANGVHQTTVDLFPLFINPK